LPPSFSRRSPSGGSQIDLRNIRRPPALTRPSGSAPMMLQCSPALKDGVSDFG
jgi:hypothetical protein